MSKNHDILEILANIIKIYLKLFQVEFKNAVNTHLFKIIIVASLIIGFTICACVLVGLVLMAIFWKVMNLNPLSSLMLTLIIFVLIITGLTRIRIFPKDKPR